MNKRIIVISINLALLLTSCASNDTAVPKPFEGYSKIFKVSSNGTVNVKARNLKDSPMNWIFVKCAHWSGCYIRCQGPVLNCKNITKKLDLKISHTITSKQNK